MTLRNVAPTWHWRAPPNALGGIALGGAAAFPCWVAGAMKGLCPCRTWAAGTSTTGGFCGGFCGVFGAGVGAFTDLAT